MKDPSDVYFGRLHPAFEHLETVMSKKTTVDAAFAFIAARCQMRVLGTGVPETRYCRVPGSWYRGRADGVGPAVCFNRPGR
ncbi:hypothetical protein ACL1GS_12480, partial [Corynebacterium striatum]